MGCGGGLPANAFNYLKTHPLEKESEYPYRSGVTKHDGICKYKCDGKFEVKKAQ